MVQIDIQKQGQKESFAAHIYSIQYFINTEMVYGRVDTSQEHGG